MPFKIGPPGTYCVVELAALTCNADRRELRPAAEAKVLGSVERRIMDEAIVTGGVNDAEESNAGKVVYTVRHVL